MKKILLGMLVLGAMASCKKDKKTNCASTVEGIAGNYKITKVEGDYPNPLPDQDLTDTRLSTCEKTGTYALKSDKTFTYSESGTGCTDVAAGTWDVVADKITINSTSGFGGVTDFTSTPITSFDCTTFVVTEDQGSGFSLKYFFTKQ
ncbi:MAG: lipocalin family protein [Ferruginibacter sp.]|nr:lipocalin family protein [Ferruginibacter sp.]